MSFKGLSTNAASLLHLSLLDCCWQPSSSTELGENSILAKLGIDNVHHKVDLITIGQSNPGPRNGTADRLLCGLLLRIGATPDSILSGRSNGLLDLSSEGGELGLAGFGDLVHLGFLSVVVGG